ncbi:hypothetical protein SBV1_230021 [Verrucomicrobia bacterium]|nr:hypothetical protein SBV1_230021 [Verrucomicrobiota bacterium]
MAFLGTTMLALPVLYLGGPRLRYRWEVTGKSGNRARHSRVDLGGWRVSKGRHEHAHAGGQGRTCGSLWQWVAAALIFWAIPVMEE